jgi:hypothetical protein
MPIESSNPSTGKVSSLQRNGLILGPLVALAIILFGDLQPAGPRSPMRCPGPAHGDMVDNGSHPPGCKTAKVPVASVSLVWRHGRQIGWQRSTSIM